MHKILALFTLTLFSSSSIAVAENYNNKTHFFDKPYQCLSTHTSKKSGKEYNTLRYYHPEKSWLIQLSAVKKKSPIKVAILYTGKGRYDGTYKGNYPDINNVKFGTFWPNNKRTINKPFSKLNKSDCKVLEDTSIFEHTYLDTLMCIDNKKTGACKT